MASEVDICNIALGKLGANPIATFLDGTTEANLCGLQYPILRDAVLAARAWTFATTRLQITSGIPPDPIPSGWGYAYLVPNDSLRIIQAYVPNPAGAVIQYIDTQFDAIYTQIDWERLIDYLYTNQGPTIWVKYIRRVTDTSKFDPNFIEALATRIAMELAIPITNNPALLDGYTKLYSAKIIEATSTEGQQGKSQVIQQPGTLAARRV